VTTFSHDRNHGTPSAEEPELAHDSSLEPNLQAVEPAARLISERHLRQVLTFLIDRGHPYPTNPDLPFWVSRDELIVADTLPPQTMVGTEPYVLLLTDPDDRMIDHLPKELQLREYWRALFQAAILREIDRKIAAGILTPAICAQRLEGFGLAAAREILYVLTAEHLAPESASASVLYRAFAATYLDLTVFEGHAAEDYFPSLPHSNVVEHVLTLDIDSVALLALTRPEGAAEPDHEPPPDERWGQTESTAEPLTVPVDDPKGLIARALAAEQKQNFVRAAILLMQVAANSSGEEYERAIGGARKALGKLVDLMGDMFSWDQDTRQEWCQALGPLLEPAARGFWPRAARCLYELQKIPADLSREIYAVDLPESIRTFGKRPVKRPLPRARPVLILMSLKKAQSQMLRARLDHTALLRLDRLFHHHIHTVEQDIRNALTPIIQTALSDAGLTPTNTVEMVARDKVVAELLDRICERGYLRLGNLRDAIARNRLKMADLSGTGEFFRGDALLRADINLAYALDGVYRKGEFYLRGIQRFSSLFFGTYLGRLFTLYIALPFGGAFLTLMFLEELRHIGEKLVHLASRPPAVAKTAAPSVKPENLAQQGLAAPEPPEFINADEIDINDEGEVISIDPKPGDAPSADEDRNEFEQFWYGTEPGAALVTGVFTSSATAIPTAEQPHASFLIAWPTIVGFGVFLLLMFHVRPFRRAVFSAVMHFWRVVRAVFWDIPLSVWRSPTVRGLRQSRPVRFMVRHFWSPLLITVLSYTVLVLVGVSPWFVFKWWWAIWAGLTIAYNTPWGWVLQDRIAEAISDWWRVVRVNLIPGLIATIIDWFRTLVNWIERQLYAVDEWLRYRGGDSQGSFAMKALLGLLWFPIAYSFRFVFYLLVEPQVNPVKHFPVVTVSHKVIWPLVPQIADLTGISVWTVGMVVNGIPGVFGFMAWELKENWKLYGKNRASRLRPVMLGSHGETMRGLLRPGFHSGTVPKLFRKLRHAGRSKSTWFHNDLEHSVEGIHRFIQRELIHLLHNTPNWGDLQIAIGNIRFGCQRLTLELVAPDLGYDAFVLAFENIDNRIEAHIEQVGWADKLNEPQREAFVAALRGVLDMTAVERINNRDRDELPTPLGDGFTDLARRVTWAEWVQRWNTDAVKS
jgi:hypothetical protein